MAYLKFDPAEFEENVDTTVHEILHILGMSSSSYPNYIDENGNRRSNVVKDWSNTRSGATKALNTPRLNSFAS